jgi:hypothetical protein
MDRMIYIPSRGRPTRQFTWARIPKAYKPITQIVVPQNEEALYMKMNPGARILCAPVEGIGRTRQWLIDHTGAKNILMFDDDMYFYHRVRPMDWHLATNEFKDTRRMLDIMFSWLEEKNFAHIGLATRTEASFYLCRYRECTRVNNVHGFNVARMRKYAEKYDARFNRMKVMEDFLVTLTLFQHGIPNRVLLDYVWNQPGSNSEGGCSSYRTAEVQRKASKKLHRLFPDYVKVVEKKVVGVTSWEGMKTRTDVRIQWRKAYNGKRRKNWKIELASQRHKVEGMTGTNRKQAT